MLKFNVQEKLVMVPRDCMRGELYMRIWDLPVNILCDLHLLGEHRELHTIWSVLLHGKNGGYSKHPETLRWKGKLAALFARHACQVKEMQNRKFNHLSPLFLPKIDCVDQEVLVDSLERQVKILNNKPCKCREKLCHFSIGLR